LSRFGLDPDRIGAAARIRSELHGYVELHIEQGPVLESENLPVGVVTATRQPITQSSEYIGRIQATNRVNLVARVSAYLDEVLFTEGAEVKKGQLQVRQYKDMLTVDVAEQLFFDSGRAALKDTGKDVLKKVGEALKGYEDKVIRVVGHTDNVPIHSAHFPSNWELSTARAVEVTKLLIADGMNPKVLAAGGYGEFDPVAANDKEEGREQNRRIEIILVPNLEELPSLTGNAP